MESGSHFFPRDRFYLAGVDLPNASFDLLGPRRFDALIGLAMEAFKEPPGQIRSLGFRELGRLQEELHYVARHHEIVPETKRASEEALFSY